MKRDFIGALVGIAGLIVIGIGAGWLSALGVFLMIYGNNLQFGNKEVRSNGK